MANWLEGYARNGTSLIRAVKRSLGLQEDGHWADRVAWQTSTLNPAKSAKKTQPAAVLADFWYGSRTKHMNEAMRQVVAAEGLPLIDWELSPLQPNGQPSQPANPTLAHFKAGPRSSTQTPCSSLCSRAHPCLQGSPGRRNLLITSTRESSFESNQLLTTNLATGDSGLRNNSSQLHLAMLVLVAPCVMLTRVHAFICLLSGM